MESTERHHTPTVSVERYLDRIGIDHVEDRSVSFLERLQTAHIRSIPFENFSIVGDPYGPYEGEPIELDLEQLYAKIVESDRGGYCFELNGPFSWLLDGLGYDADRVAARVVSGNASTIPANHLAIVVELDQRYLVDVGIGLPKIGCPIPIEGDVPIPSLGLDWRVEPAERPDVDYVLQYHDETEGWVDHYLFTDEPRDLTYFEAVNDYLQTSPDSPFTSDPLVNIATRNGYVKADHKQVEIDTGGDASEHSIRPDGWAESLERYFSLRLPRG